MKNTVIQDEFGKGILVWRTTINSLIRREQRSVARKTNPELYQNQRKQPKKKREDSTGDFTNSKGQEEYDPDDPTNGTKKALSGIDLSHPNFTIIYGSSGSEKTTMVKYIIRARLLLKKFTDIKIFTGSKHDEGDWGFVKDKSLLFSPSEFIEQMYSYTEKEKRKTNRCRRKEL